MPNEAKYLVLIQRAIQDKLQVAQASEISDNPRIPSTGYPFQSSGDNLLPGSTHYAY